MSHLNLTDTQSLLNNVLPRIGASVSMVCALYMATSILKSKFYCSRIFHRIMLGCAINTVLLNVNEIWGPAAVPTNEYTQHITGTHGTQATCSIQGFIYQFSSFVVPFHYVALSMMSYAAVRTKFQVDNYSWIEKYLHLGTYVFPLGSAIYLLMVEAYNPAIRDCYVVNHPFGCVVASEATDNVGNDNDDNRPICTRGPDNINSLQLWLSGVPFVAVLVAPGLIMAALYCKVRQESKSKEIAKSVGIQCGVYLLALYWTYLFRLVDGTLYVFFEQNYYVLNILANFVEACKGAWFLIAYLYLRSDDPTRFGMVTIGMNNSEFARAAAAAGTFHSSESTKNGESNPKSEGKRKGNEIIFNHSGELNQADLNSSIKQPLKPQFSIFDGFSVDSDSPWAKFLQEDIGEDCSYMQSSEYDDTENFYLTGEMTTTTSLDTAKQPNNFDETMADPNTSVDKNNTKTPTSS